MAEWDQILRTLAFGSLGWSAMPNAETAKLIIKVFIKVILRLIKSRQIHSVAKIVC